MTNLFDYLNWRGDLTLEHSEFNNVDALILARLSYLAFDNIVSPSFENNISIIEAADKFFSQDPSLIEDSLILKDDFKLLKKLSTTERFKNMTLSGYVNEINEEIEKQFSAITIKINEDEYFISYRGTDNTFVGWKEDFNMSFMDTVPSQISAKNYLNSFASIISNKTYLAGHSKGGNLSIYSAAFCSPKVQEQIIKVYNFDGPGFSPTVLEKKCFQNIVSKISTFIPQSSIVGMLLEHKEEYNTIHSYQEGILQHDLYSWEINVLDFVYVKKTTKDSVFFNQTLNDWLYNTSQEQREEFFEVIYKILLGTNVSSVAMLDITWYSAAKELIKSYRYLDEKSKEMVSITIKELMSSAIKNYITIKPKLLGF